MSVCVLPFRPFLNAPKSSVRQHLLFMVDISILSNSVVTLYRITNNADHLKIIGFPNTNYYCYFISVCEVIFTLLESRIFTGLAVSLSAQQQSPLYFSLNVCVCDWGAAGCSDICHSQQRLGAFLWRFRKVSSPRDSTPNVHGGFPASW